MNKLTEWLIDDLLTEEVKLDVKVGDTVLMGRFKNKRVVVKSIDFNEKGDMMINGRSALKFRTVKPKKALLPVSRTDKDSTTPDADMKGVKEKVDYEIKNIYKLLIKYGNSAKKASDILKKHYKYVAKKYAKADVRDKTMALIGLAGLSENIPSPSRAGVKKNKTDKMSGYKKVNELLSEKPLKKKKKFKSKIKRPSAKSRLMKLKRNYYLKPEKAKKELEKSGLPGNVISKKVGKQRLFFVSYHKPNVNLFDEANNENVEKTLDLYMKNVVYSIVENTQIKKVIGIYGGRFQPFGPHHLKTYKWLESKVDEAYITTSDLKKPPRHPMNFKEKVRHMTKMGVPSNRIVMEQSPYVAKNTLSKFDPNTTAVVYIFGKKDSGRLTGGKYFQDYDKNNLTGYEEHGFIMTAPHISMNIAGMEISGTTMRKVLGSPKIKDEDRPKVFKKLFGYYDKGVYNMMTNKFKKLFEFITNIKPLLKEVSSFNSTFKASSLSDEGFYDFFKTFKDYKRVSPKHAEILGWSVIGDIIGKNATSSRHDDLLKVPGMGGAVDTVTFGKTINQNTKNTASVKDPFKKHEKYMRNIIKTMGWEVVKFMGSKTVDIQDSELMDMIKVLSNSEREKVLKEEKELLLMGGAYGHMSHPFDNNDLTFGDLKNIITLGLGGKLDREDGVTEKLDGQNLMISWVDGELKAARNKGHLKNKGTTAPNTDGVKKIFAGRGNVEKAFVSAMTDLSRAVRGLSDAQKEKVFGNGTKWMNLEIMYPATANVVDYDVAEIVFHGTLEYDDSGSPIGQPKDSARMLAGMIKQVNANVQKTFKIGKPNFLKVPKTQDFGKKKRYFLGKLKTIQGHYALKDSNRLGEYHQAFWQEYVFNASKQFGVKLKNNEFVQLVNRWAYFDKSYKVPMIKKDYADRPKFLDWILSTDKNDHSKIFKDNIQPIETLFFEVGVEILKNISGYMAASPDKTIQKMKKEVESALKDLKSGGNPEKLKKLKLQIEKLEAIGGVNAIVPTEGVVFKYKGKVYKFTGAFAPINQILGSLKFG